MDSTNRPRVWVGHIIVSADNVAESTAFYIDLGMREVETEKNASVLELRSGTHLIVLKGDPALQASFDLMVDDLEATHAEWASRGLQVGEIFQVAPHEAFTVVDPSGTKVTVYSSRVVGNG